MKLCAEPSGVTVIEVRTDGTEHRYVDEDMKAEIQTKYLEALPKCKVIK